VQSEEYRVKRGGLEKKVMSAGKNEEGNGKKSKEIGRKKQRNPLSSLRCPLP